MRRFAKYWRDSASLLILARDGVKKPSRTSYNYKVLVFKRTEKTSFMPNSIVFPGGAVDKQDENLQWNGIFSRLGGVQLELENLSKVDSSRPFIFENSSPDALDRNISLRLTALREAFEELGVLHGQKKEQAGLSSDGYSSVVENFDVPTWQKAVHDSEKSFAELCEKLNIIPDVFNTYEWSTWLTPAMFRKRRFETVFYLVALNEMPEVVSEPHEVAEYFWDTPSGLLQAHKDEKLWLAPPQHYELTRLSHMYDIDEIVSFAKARSGKGSTLFCPVQYICSDAAVFVLPGDDLYPKNYDYITPHGELEQYKESTAEELRSHANRLHRCEHRGLHLQSYYSNIMPFNGHLSIHGDNKHLSKL
ncbi:acyl-coenzyme A diphosphatase NUDT19-like [Sabethes cyaneus]|uniref:acyl-coenzyme A diphosphatase NUDT19-like n=1 Tax=Sabethes cyaneus TaxID=53552 RepID=UPI00237E2293|nr:acyl-coenzyme A diphosphatase NUDT19-like [Sabethes cyaneus]